MQPFRFKRFAVFQRGDVMKVNTDAVLLGAWATVAGGGLTLDVGTGTGVIALMLAQRGAHRIAAIDIEPEAVRLAQANAARSPWASQIAVQEQPFQLWAEDAVERCRHIVSNPPYFNDSLPSPRMSRTVARHSVMLPHDELLRSVLLCLSQGGHFSAVFPLAEGSLFISMAAREGLYLNRVLHVAAKHEGATKRMLCEFSAEAGLLEDQYLSIYGPDGGYSAEYKRLTQDFYLAF